MINPIVSIIIPVYRVEQYLCRCVESVLAQTFQDFELLLIDDGSPDNSGKICDDYAKIDKRIHVYHKENGGVTSARKVGLEKSVGKFIFFVDSDDTLPIDAIKGLYEKITSLKLDIVLGGWNKIEKKYQRIIPLTIDGIYSANDYIKFLLTEKCYVGPVGRLIKRELFDENTLNISSKIIINEDLIMNLRLALNAKKIGIFSSDVVYNYHQNEGSASTRKLTNSQCEILFSTVKNILPKEYYKYFLKYITRFFYQYNYLDYKKNVFYKQIVNNKSTFTCTDKYYYYGKYLMSSNNRFFWNLMVNLIDLFSKIKKLFFLIKYKCFC